ncbi:MAG: hypothetical protein ACXWJJ_06845 [Ramlibacter sp.]
MAGAQPATLARRQHNSCLPLLTFAGGPIHRIGRLIHEPPSMPTSRPSPACRLAATVFLLAACAAPLGGCAVVAAVDTAAGLAVSGAGLAADAAIGTARIAGKVVGAAADAAIPDGNSK